MQLNSKIVMESMLIFNADDTKKKYQEEYNTIRKSLAEFFLSDYNVRNFDRFESLLVSHISNIREKPDLIRLVTGFATQIDSCHRETLDIAFVINSFKGLLPNVQNEVYKEVAYNIVNGYCDTFFIRLITFRDLGILDVFTKNIEFCKNSAFAIIENLVKMFDAYEHMRWPACNRGPNEEVFGVAQIISHIINKNVERIRAEGSEGREKIHDLVATMVYCLIINLLFNKVVPVCDIKLTLQDIENNISSDFDLQCVVRDATTETLKRLSAKQKDSILTEWLSVFYGVEELPPYVKYKLVELMEFYDMKESASESLLDSVTQTTTTTTDETEKSKTRGVAVELLSSVIGASDSLSE